MIPLLLLIGFFYITRDSWAALLKSAKASKGQGGNEVAWWGREAAHGFPHFRGPLAAGWRDNQTSAARIRNVRMSTKPEHIRRMADLKDQTRQHRRNIRDARQPASQPTASQPAGNQPATQPPLTLSRKCPNCGDDLAWGTPHVCTAPTSQNGHPMPCRDPNCQCHQTPAPPNGGAGATAINGGTMTSTTTGDTTYDQAQETIAAIKRDAEQAVPPALINDVSGLADGLPSMIPDDAETVSHVADSLAALQRAQVSAAEAIEHADAAKASLEKNFQDEHEAVQATGHQSNQGFHAG